MPGQDWYFTTPDDRLTQVLESSKDEFEHLMGMGHRGNGGSRFVPQEIEVVLTDASFAPDLGIGYLRIGSARLLPDGTWYYKGQFRVGPGGFVDVSGCIFDSNRRGFAVA